MSKLTNQAGFGVSPPRRRKAASSATRSTRPGWRNRRERLSASERQTRRILFGVLRQGEQGEWVETLSPSDEDVERQTERSEEPLP